jgi:hypothetical protein
MERALVYRVMSLIPERTPRLQSGTVFGQAAATSSAHPERFALLARFLHWLGPLDALSREDQQFLGLRNGGGRPLGEDAEPGEETDELADEAQQLEEQSIRTAEAGTHIAA